MTGIATLIAVTGSGGRPAGPRGAPLHDSAEQLRRVVRRRLGDATADLLATPHLRADGRSVEWFADWSGDVRPLAEIEPARRAALLLRVELGLADIRRLGESLSADAGGEDTGAVGRSLVLAGRLADEALVFVVGDRPVVIAWGYDRQAVPGLQPRRPHIASPPPPSTASARRPVLQAPVAIAPPRPPAPPRAAAGAPLGRTFLAGVPLVLLVLAAAWQLRDLLPGPPGLTLSMHEAAAADAPPPPADPLPVLKTALADAQAQHAALNLELRKAEGDLAKKVAACKPAEEAKPPQVAVAPPPPPPPRPEARPEPRPAPQSAPPPQRQTQPGDDRLRLPSSPTNDYSFLQGCWRTDPFRHELAQAQPGVSSYCFDANGQGQLEWRRGRTACRTRAQARFEGDVLRLRDSDTTCNDGSRWYADQLVCRRGAGDIANCSGSSRGAFGPVNWTVNLHKLP
ncbi:MAG: hypothetical protein KIT25_09930 [Enhydrobacter sp.]|nr:MAG: hypothetical protein KIT25_09930 [Enhydrobacter sp.]